MLFWKFERPVWPPTAKMCWISACNTAKWQQPLLYLVEQLPHCDLLRLSHMTERFVFSREQIYTFFSLIYELILFVWQSTFPFFFIIYELILFLRQTFLCNFKISFMSSFYLVLHAPKIDNTTWNMVAVCFYITCHVDRDLDPIKK